MVIVRAVEVLHVQRQAGVLGKGLKPLLEQLGVHGAELVAAEIHLPDEIGAVRRIERHPGQGLVHRNERLTIAPDALALDQGLGHRLADHDAAVLGGVVIVDMQIALRSEEHTSELQSLMRISYAVFCLKKKTTKQTTKDLDNRINNH